MKIPEIPANRADDLHNFEYLGEEDLLIFLAGNQFMLAEELMHIFKKYYPEAKKIVYETLPPGLELKQILAGRAYYQGKYLELRPDVYTCVAEKALQVLEENKLLAEKVLYAHNRLVLMVKKGNPKSIKSLEDLLREDVIISQPNPEIEDIGIHIVRMYEQALGKEGLAKIMVEKVRKGTTLLTTVHHRETPENLLKNKVDVGVVWATEVKFASAQGLALEGIDLPANLDQRDKINYYACLLRQAKHKLLGKAFLEFLQSREVRELYTKYGFLAPLS